MLGSGTYGKVYLVPRKSDKELFAAKKIEIFEQDKEKLINELVTQLSVNNLPCVLPIFDIFVWVYDNEGDPKIIVVMYILAGDPEIKNLEGLIEYYRKEKLTMDNKLLYNLISQLIQALIACSERNVYHRDLKPDNIIIKR